MPLWVIGMGAWSLVMAGVGIFGEEFLYKTAAWCMIWHFLMACHWNSNG